MFLQAEAAAPSVLQLFMPFIIMMVFLYFFMIRPEQKRKKEYQAMLDVLKKGDKVVTIGGIYGEITALKEDYVTLKVADKTEIKVRRSGIGSVVK